MQKATVHPLVLLSAVDHYNREASNSESKRACGILLGKIFGGVVEITNSFAAPFEENMDDKSWFFDAQYIERMRAMIRKVSSLEVIIGWYSAFPSASIRINDLEIQRSIKESFCANPVFLVVDVQPKGEFPTTAYVSNIEEKEDGTELSLAFRHIPSEMGALEAEEIGVEHLLRDSLDARHSSLSTQILQRTKAFSVFTKHIGNIQQYLKDVQDKKLPLNQKILYLIQEIFNFVPDLNIPELTKGMMINNNDMNMVMYMQNLLQTTLSLFNLIENKIQLQNKAENDAREEEEKKKKEREKKEKIQQAKEKQEKEDKEREERLKEIEKKRREKGGGQ